MGNGKKLFTATIMLLIAFFAVVTATYAWFTVQNTPEVGNISLGASEGDGVYMSLDKTNWQNSLDGNELYDFLGYYYDNLGEKTYAFNYKNVTPTATSDGFIATFNELKMVSSNAYQGNYYQYRDITGTVSNASTFTKAATSKLNDDHSTDAGYVSFNLYLKSVKEVNLYLYGLAVRVNSEGSEIDEAAAKMVRIGFTNQSTPSKTDVLRIINPSNNESTDLNTDQIKRSEIGGASTDQLETGFYAKTNIENFFRDLYNNNSNDKDMLVKDTTYKAPDDESNEVLDDYVCYKFNPSHNSVNNIKAAIEKSYNMGLIQGNFDYQKPSQLSITSKEASVGDELLTIPAWNGDNIDDTDGTNFVTLTVYIWLEGWDNNTTDKAQDGKFFLDFKFVGLPTDLEFAS